MYSNKFVVCLLLNGEVQKELANGVVKLPFGSEYALRFRNKHNRRAVVQIYVDGENVSGGGYVIPANDAIDIKRHHDKDRAFKFVSLDSPDAIEHGKNGPNEDKVKGTIEARFYLEKEKVQPVYPVVIDHHHHHHHDHYVPTPIYPEPWPKPWRPYGPWCGETNITYGGSGYATKGGSGLSMNMGGGGSSCSLGGMTKSTLSCGESEMKTSSFANPAGTFADKSALYSCDSIKHISEADYAARLNESMPLQDGCTVEGNASGQSFYSTWVDMEETYTSVKIFLQGFVPKTQTVQTAEGPKVAAESPSGETKFCGNCGAKIAKKKANFCHVCGTKL